MQFPAPVSVDWLSKFINAEVGGNQNGFATGINELHKVSKADVVFVDHPKYYDACLQSEASFIIINKMVDNIPEGKTLLKVDNPFEAYCKIVNHFRPFIPAEKRISDTAKIDEGSFIYPTAFIGAHVTIGKNCIIHPSVCIMDYSVIGNNVIVQAGTVIGSDAFYYNTKKDREVWLKKMPSCGHVVIEDDVEIGANCTIDRGVSDVTRIGKGSKLDNIIHIGHDTVIGNNCLIASNVVIAGVVTIEDGVTLWGGVIINKVLTIGANAVLLGRTGVSQSLEGNKTYWGAPAQEAGIVRRELVWIKRIPQLWEKVMKQN